MSPRSKGRAETDVQGEQFVHRELWHVVERQMEHAAANPKGNFYDHLAAMIFAFLSLEAYLNFVGERLDPQTWRDERVHFRGNGFKRKLARVLTLVGVVLPVGARPRQTIVTLNKLRDMMAHGKTLPIARTLRHAAGKAPPLNQGPLDGLISRQQAEIAVADVLAVAGEIHKAGTASVRFDPWWGDAPFGGVTMHVSGSTRIKDAPSV